MKKKGVFTLIAISCKRRLILKGPTFYIKDQKTQAQTEKKQVVQGLLAVAIQITFSNKFRLLIVSSIVVVPHPLIKKCP